MATSLRSVQAGPGPTVEVERQARHGQETSSRNSEVIHAGIYYEPGSLKARLCVEGKQMLYRLCAANDIPHRRITKIITATQEAELGEMELLVRRGRENGVDLMLLTAQQVRAREPEVATVGGILSPSTGIVSAHGLMDYLHHRATERGAIVQTRCTVTALRQGAHGYEVEIDESGRRSTFTSEVVINAAGLEADTVAGMAGIDVDTAGYRLRYCKGSYFSVAGSLRAAIRALVTPSKRASASRSPSPSKTTMRVANRSRTSLTVPSMTLRPRLIRTMRSHMRSAWFIWCVENTTVEPAWRSSVSSRSSRSTRV